MEKSNLTVKAINKNVRSSPRKLALVLNFIKGKKADVALKDLEFTRKRIAKDVSKTVKSAISNAENNHQYDIDNLFVKEPKEELAQSRNLSVELQLFSRKKRRKNNGTKNKSNRFKIRD